MLYSVLSSFFFFFNDTATTEIYTLSLHDALPISLYHRRRGADPAPASQDIPSGCACDTDDCLGKHTACRAGNAGRSFRLHYQTLEQCRSAATHRDGFTAFGRFA